MLLCTSFFALFVSYLSRAPPHLHSFPTRRSSDLPASTGCPRRAVTDRAHARLRAGRVREVRSLLLRAPSRLDRKSTRLNSSHRCISYAVFCLKKKKTKNTKQPLEYISHIFI